MTGRAYRITAMRAVAPGAAPMGLAVKRPAAPNPPPLPSTLVETDEDEGSGVLRRKR